MASSGFATPSLNWSSPNLPEAFRSFCQYSTLIFDGPFANKTEKEKVTYLLLWIGSHGRDIFDGWTWNTPEEKFRIQIVLERFQRYIEPQVILFGKVHFPPVLPGSGRVSGRNHCSLSCECSEMQIRGPHGDKYSTDGAAALREMGGKTHTF